MKHPKTARRVLLLLAAPLCANAQTTFADLSLEQLLSVPVVSASKKASTLGETAAAITRFSGDEVVQSGALTLAESLRAVPGVHVGQISSSTWAINARGFTHEYANKLLVLVDGRPVYSTSFGGVFWNEQDLILADLESVEVIRGPGGTLWGANAMNGVINFTTKPVRDTQGGYLSVVHGTNTEPTVSLRYGGQVAPGVYYRVWSKYLENDELLEDGDQPAKGWQALRGGFRLDIERDPRTDLTFEAAAYEGRQDWIPPVSLFVPPGTPLPDRLSYEGGHARARAVHRQSPDASFEGQVSYSVSKHENQGYTTDDRTWNVDLQQRFLLGERHDVVAGLGWAITDNRMIAGLASLSPATSREDVWSAFVQDEIALAEKLHLTVGSKFEHNDVTGNEYQPSARLLWRATPRQSYWAAVSRAVRTPSRLNRAAYTAPGLGVPPGSSPIQLVAEELLSTELGVRYEISPRLSVDAALFFNRYDNVVTSHLDGPFFDPLTGPYFQLVMSNSLEADSVGGEITLNWTPLDAWRLRASVSVVDMDTRPSGDIPGKTSSFLARLESTVHLAPRWQWFQALNHVSDVDTYDIPAYTRFDTGLTWIVNDRLTASLWVQNAFDPRHPEYINPDNRLPLLEVPRSVFARLTWRF